MALSTTPKDANNPFPRTADVTNSNDMSRSFSGWEPKKLWLTPADGGRSTECAFAEGFDSRADGRSLVSADLDGDGDLDLVMRNRAAAKLQLFENEGPVGRSVEVQLVPASSSSPEGEGAQVFEGGRVFPVVLARGYASGVDPIVHIGLGGRTTAALEVKWRSGKRTTHTVPAGRRVRLFENGSEALVAAVQPKPRAKAKPFPSTLKALGLEAEKDITVVQLFLKGCKPCEEEVPALAKLKDAVQLVSLGLHEGAALQDAAKSMGITWPVATLSNDVADALSSSGNLPFPILLVYRKGALERVLPGPRGVEALVSSPKE